MTAIVTDAHYRMSVSLIRDLFDRGVRVAACGKRRSKPPSVLQAVARRSASVCRTRV